MNILLFQDAGHLTQRLIEFLEGRGHAVTQVRDLEALRRVGRAADFDVLLLDMHIATFDPMAFLESQCRFGQAGRTILLSLDENLCGEVFRLGIAEENVIGDAPDLSSVAEIVERIGQADGSEPSSRIRKIEYRMAVWWWWRATRAGRAKAPSRCIWWPASCNKA
jgi:DNA-binding NtrC family response regulator